MSKKLLKESQVRRFMGLAGMQAHTVSNYLKESPGMYEQEPAADEELPPEGGEMPPMDDMGGDEMADAPPMDDMGGDDLEGGEEASADVDPDAIKDLRARFEDVMAPLEAALPGGEEEGELEEPVDELPPVEELPAEEPADLEGEEDELEALEEAGIQTEMNEDEVVQEVARRVAKRILAAKRAQDKMHEALGRRKPTRKTAAKPAMRKRRTTRRKK